MKIKRVITKSKSGHYTACINLDGWNLYKAVKIGTLSKARFLLDEAAKAINKKTFINFQHQGYFVFDRVERFLKNGGSL